VRAPTGRILLSPGAAGPAVLQEPAGPLDLPPARQADPAGRYLLLLEALADVRLGDYDLRVIDWLAVADTATVLTVASLIRRAREAGGHTSAAAAATPPSTVGRP